MSQISSLNASPSPTAQLQQCLAILRKARKPIVFGYLTALKIHALELPQACTLAENVLQASCKLPAERSTMKTIRYCVSSAPRITQEIQVQGGSVTVTDPVSTCIQLAAYCSKEETTCLFDQLLRRNNPQRGANYKLLEDLIHNSPPFKGKQTALWALQHCAPLTDSSMETRLRLILSKASLPTPIINCKCMDPETGEFWFADLAYPEAGLILEYQGVEWHKTPEQVRADAHKLSSLQYYDCKIIQVTAPDLIVPARRERLIADVRRRIKLSRTFTPQQRASFATLFSETTL